MRTTVNLDEDTLLAARELADRQGISLGAAISALIRRGVQAGGASGVESPPRGRFALLGARDELITVQHVRHLLEREGA